MANRWQDRAHCRGMDPEFFYPDPSGPSHVAKIRELCGGCPVAGECLDHALANNDNRFGYFGGKSPQERRKIATQRERDRMDSEKLARSVEIESLHVDIRQVVRGTTPAKWRTPDHWPETRRRERLRELISVLQVAASSFDLGDGRATLA